MNESPLSTGGGAPTTGGAGLNSLLPTGGGTPTIGGAELYVGDRPCPYKANFPPYVRKNRGPQHPLIDSLWKLRKGIRSTPLGRFYCYLKRVRYLSHTKATTASDGSAPTVDVAPSVLERDLLPMHLPLRPPAIFSNRITSRRRRRRQYAHRAAWEVCEWLTAIFGH